MNIVLFDGEERENLLPLTFTKPVASLRMGVLTFTERWERLLNTTVSYKTVPYLVDKFPINLQSENIFINPSFFPSKKLVETINSLIIGQSIVYNNELVAVKTVENEPTITVDSIIFEEELIHIKHSWDLFSYNFQAIEFDFELLTAGKTSQPISSTNRVLHSEKIFLEEGAKVEFAILNASEGPIYIGKDAEIMEGSMIRGGLALCEHAKINMGAKIYAGCTIGPYCKVGGELNNAILMAYSNKGHDGFLGNAVIGEWCNLGADTNNSNLKNNYAEVKLWSYKEGRFVKTGLQFCGLIMGDYAKSAINTQFNTGTVVGVCANVFQSGFPPNLIKHYSWGGNSDAPIFSFDRACEAAEKMMERRKVDLTATDRKILEHIFNLNNK
ncbi:UDP-N-acetylglucosamine diphosphorylase/glucosamine-1-phosphate N-acetyltransferase [Algoriella xinjiangensis]|uniref:UDP-N-acetylglucosamine diphosphorylase/glucosamine-1-phosphate N-acetyltransferase n=1 Tax=Algoriella xinjiangensis TaxID=684065 RepID=A0A1I4YXR3_9FLAO|nr:GlmU family protein [Algoriella xinjiangensis]SFN42814.1 UDP-N-acetylglucosamine diphosphorylase/glucosamine-1-phosphate N-acetyltransferase [Algoriella xinjiangensis]VDH16647.1 UDP-N-acetylglucosamine diphosphorylase/glucosamine-1-phosphate N-acetyltransferase [Algoriella xinjiangensis]